MPLGIQIRPGRLAAVGARCRAPKTHQVRRFSFLPRLDRSLVRQQMSRNSLITLDQPLTPRKGSASSLASKDPPVAQRVLLNFRRSLYHVSPQTRKRVNSEKTHP